MGAFLWLSETVTGKKVYTLLLNVDFLPVIGKVEWPVFIEWLFHMVISWAIGILYAWLILYCCLDDHLHKWLLSLGFAALAAATYFPLTLHAEKETSSVHDWTALLLWLAGHVVYAALLKKADDYNSL
nr:hypothetical protein [Thalassobacillus pellis]